MKSGALLTMIAAFSRQAQPLPYREVSLADSRPVPRVNSNLVLVPVTVADSRGAVVPKSAPRGYRVI